MDAWVRLFDTLVNRVSIVNQILGARYEGSSDCPCVLSYRKGVYTISICGTVYITFRVYDAAQLDAAFGKIDSLADGLWYLSRSGRMKFT